MGPMSAAGQPSHARAAQTGLSILEDVERLDPEHPKRAQPVQPLDSTPGSNQDVTNMLSTA
jgi:hypothetical protein